MAPITSNAQHHHRSTTKTSHKPFKARHLTKSAVKEKSKGKVEQFEKGSRKTPYQQVMSKLDRRNQAKQRRLTKDVAHDRAMSVFAGREGAPRIVAVVPLCEDVDSVAVIKSLNESVDIDEQRSSSGAWRLEVPRFKQRVQYLTPGRDLLQALDACRLADFVLFVLSAEQEVDGLGEQMLRCVESQGVSTVLTVVHNLSIVEPAKRRPDVLKSLKSFITHFFATQEKVFDLGSRQEGANVMRSLCTMTPKGIRWREDRSWMLLEDVRWEGEDAVATGVVRGRGLKADRLVQFGEWGDFQISKITAAPLELRKKAHANGDAMAVDESHEEQVLEEPTANQDDLDSLAPEDATIDDVFMAPTASLAASERKGVLLDDHHYFDDDESHLPDMPKRLPKGTSTYQAAWFLGDISDSGSDMQSVNDDENKDEMDLADGSTTAGPAEGHFNALPEPTEVGASEYPPSEMFLDPAPEEEEEQLAAYRKQRRDDAEDDREFPDEIELNPQVVARERLARYRGLKSLRTSHWETEEDKPCEPEDWSRLLEVSDYKAAKHKVLKETILGGVKPGVRVNVHLRIPSSQAAHFQSLARPTALFSLLRHEHKRTSANHSITLSSDFARPLKSKEELILQCGPRRLVINPLFSQAGNTPNNVHKFDRYLHPTRTAIASFVGPLTWGSVPCLYFKRTTLQPTSALTQSTAAPILTLVATGTSLPPSSTRIIAKRIILTGHPYKIHKKLVTVRYMFFHAEDVLHFKALQLWTKRGRSGFAKEPLGTHGYFKATFDGKINPLDSVGVSMYKRVWPRTARAWRAGVEVEEVPELIAA